MNSGGDPFRKVAILGTGMMGGSLAGSLKRLADPPVVVGTTRNDRDRALALERGWVDLFYECNPEAVSGADLVILAVPPGEVIPTWKELCGHLPAGTVVTDLSSIKGPLSDHYQAFFEDFFPDYSSSHPMAGSERSGMAGASPDLFTGRTVFLTPFGTQGEKTGVGTLTLLTQFWKRLGASTVPVVSPQDHDGIVAYISHLPHVLSYALFRLVDRTQRQNIFQGFDWTSQKGGSFSDVLRVARSSPFLWSDIFHENRAALLSAIDSYGTELGRLREAIETMGQADLANLLQEWTSSLALESPVPSARDSTA